MTNRILFLTFLCLSLGSVGTAFCQTTITEMQKLGAQDAGASVSISGDFVFVGAPLDDSLGSDAGSVSVFRNNGAIWVLEQTLTKNADAADPAAPLDQFGFSVSVSGNVALVGTVFDDHSGKTDAGSVSVFRYNSSALLWEWKQTLIAPVPESGDAFGYDVSLSGNLAVVGNPLHFNGIDVGSADVFRDISSTFAWEQTLIASDAPRNAYFGLSVSASGDVVVVGAPLDSQVTKVLTGSAYVFRHNGASWAPESKLSVAPSQAMNFDWFGHSVSVSGNVAVVGTRRDGVYVPAYVYRYESLSKTWPLEQELVRSDASGAFDRFGRAVSVSGSLAVVGASEDQVGGTSQGSAYLFRYDGLTWVEERKLLASDGAYDDEFGWDVAADGDVILAGTQRADGAYIYDLFCCPIDPSCPSLRFNGPATVGSPVNFRITLTPAEAGYKAIVVISCSCTTERLTVPTGFSLPITPDSCTGIGMTLSGIFTATVNTSGIAETSVFPMPTLPPGIVIYSAAAAVDVGGGGRIVGTCPISITQ